MSLFGDNPTGTAVLSECGTYRYLLTRTWNPDAPAALFVMLNPSTADGEQDDPTIRRCLGFARSWTFGRLEVVNLFALRATDPAELKRAVDPVGPENDRHVGEAVRRCELVVCAWGSGGGFHGRDRAVLRMIRDGGHEPMCLRLSGGGHPWHPLYLPAGLRPIPDRHTGPDGLRYLPVYTIRRVPDPWCWQRPSFWACVVFVGVWVWILRRLWT